MDLRRSPLLAVFLLAEGGLYLYFLASDLWRGGVGSVPAKYLSIVLCAAMAIWSACRGGSALTAWALVCTLGADTFLLLLDRWYLLGVILFCGVQALYAMRLAQSGAGAHLRGRVLAGAALTLAVWLLGLLTPVTAAAAVYLASFLISLWLSWSQPGTRGRLLFWGLALYLCCDICVGAYNFPQLFPAVPELVLYVGMWLFYLPGQVLLVLSGLPDGMIKRP